MGMISSVANLQVITVGIQSKRSEVQILVRSEEKKINQTFLHMRGTEVGIVRGMEEGTVKGMERGW